MKNIKHKLRTILSPLLGAGAIAICPACWAGSASLLTYLGIAAIIPAWRWIAYALIFIALGGFLLDYRYHKNIYPTLLLSLGGVLLYLGRYVWGGEGFGGWPIWGVGIIIIIIAVWYNKKLFSRGASQSS
jgi:hypothetical protein